MLVTSAAAQLLSVGSSPFWQGPPWAAEALEEVVRQEPRTPGQSSQWGRYDHFEVPLPLPCPMPGPVIVTTSQALIQKPCPNHLCTLIPIQRDSPGSPTHSPGLRQPQDAKVPPFRVATGKAVPQQSGLASAGPVPGSTDDGKASTVGKVRCTESLLEAS